MDSTVSRSHKLLVIVPAYQEEASIAHVVGAVIAAHAGNAARQLPAADVLVIDDGSCDQTAAQAQAAGAIVLRLPFNLGIGGAVQAGFQFAAHYGYGFTGRVDGDGQHNPADLHTLLMPVLQGRADVAIGTRFASRSLLNASQAPAPTAAPPAPHHWVPVSRRLGIRIFAWLVALLTGQAVTDPTSGLQVANRRAIEFLARFYPQDYPEIEARILLHRAGLRVVELPVVMAPRRGGVSSINHWRGAYYMVKVTLAVLIAAVKQIPTLTPHRPENPP